VDYAQTTPSNCDPDTGTEIDAVAFSPDGRTLATAGNDGSDIKIWTFDGHVLTPTGTVLNSDGWWSMTFSADGSMLAVAVTDGIDLWRTSNWSFITELVGSSSFFKGVAFTPDQTHVIGMDDDGSLGNLYLWNLNGSPRELPILTLALGDEPAKLAVSSKVVGGGVGIAVGYYDGFADVLAYAGGAFTKPTNLTVDAAGSPVWAGDFSPDGTLLALGDDDSVIHFWTYPLTGKAENGKELMLGATGNDDSVYALAFSPNGGYIVAGGGYSDSDSNASYWSTTARAGSISISTSHDVTALAFSPGGNAIAGGELNCGTVLMCVN
jgi:WD40 repeat protein